MVMTYEIIDLQTVTSMIGGEKIDTTMFLVRYYDEDGNTINDTRFEIDGEVTNEMITEKITVRGLELKAEMQKRPVIDIPKTGSI
jgi:hypothetical protein